MCVSREVFDRGIRRFGHSFAALAALIVFLASSPVPAADGMRAYAYDGGFDDAVFEVETAILDRGLVIDYVSHVGAMLNRTKADVGGSKDLFENASVLVFCSAVLSRDVMEADPMNVAFCPYGIFVVELAGGGTVQVGYRTMPAGPMKKVEALLDGIARSATGK